jgi:hypothetical protein
MISNPVDKAKPVVFSQEGLWESERLFNQLFGAPSFSAEQSGRS